MILVSEVESLVLKEGTFVRKYWLIFMLQNFPVGNFRVMNLSQLKMVISCSWQASLIVRSGALSAVSWIYNTEIWSWRLFPTLCLVILVAMKTTSSIVQ